MLEKIKSSKILGIVIGIISLPLVLNFFSMMISLLLNLGRFIGSYLSAFVV